MNIPRKLLILFTVVLIAKSCIFYSLNDNVENFLTNDSNNYTGLTAGIDSTGEYKYVGSPHPEAKATPGYPYFLYLIQSIFPSNPISTVIFIQIFLSSVTIFFVYQICINIGFGANIALIASLFWSIDWTSWTMSLQIMTETLHIFFLLLGVCLASYVARTEKKRQIAYAMTSMLSISASAYFRPISIYIMPVLLLFFVISRSYKHSMLHGAILGLALTSLSGLMLLPWMVRNHHAFGVFTFSLSGPHQLIEHRVASVVAKLNGTTRIESLGKLKEADPKLLNYDFPEHQSKTAIDLAKKYILGHPLIFAQNTAVNITRGMMVPNTADFLRQCFNRVIPWKGPFGDVFRLSGPKEYFAKWLSKKHIVFVITEFSALCFLIAIYLLNIYLLGKFWFNMGKDGKYLVTLLLTMVIIIVGLSAGSEFYARYRLAAMPFLYVGAALAIGLMTKNDPKIKTQKR